MDKEATYFVKFKEQIFGPMNQANLINEISFGVTVHGQTGLYKNRLNRLIPGSGQVRAA